MFRILLAASAVACLTTGANAFGGHQSSSMNGTSLNGMNLQGIELQGMNLQGIELQGMSLQGITLQGVNMQGREIGVPSNSPIVEQIRLPTGEEFDLR